MASNIRATDLGRIANEAEPLLDMALPWHIDLSNVLAETRRRLWPELDEPRGLDE